jgi:hypothetical protein
VPVAASAGISALDFEVCPRTRSRGHTLDLERDSRRFELEAADNFSRSIVESAHTIHCESGLREPCIPEVDNFKSLHRHQLEP